MVSRPPIASVAALAIAVASSVFAAAGPPATAPVAARDSGTETVERLAPGLSHRSRNRGRASETPSHQVVAGAFPADRQEEADEFLATLRAQGFPAIVVYTTAYEIRVPGFATAQAAQAVAERMRALGLIEETKLLAVGQDLSNPSGPWAVHVLEADPAAVEVVVAHSYDAAIGAETTRSLARRRGALAAINGGYYTVKGALRGESQGVLKIDGRVLSEPDRNRAAVGFLNDETRVRAIFGRLGMQARAVFSNGFALPIDGINRTRGKNETILYTPEFHRTTLSEPGGAEIVVRGEAVVELREGEGSSLIPAEGGVLSLSAEVAKTALPLCRDAPRVAIETSLIPAGNDSLWSRARSVLGGGPLLLLDGRRIEQPEVESVSRVFYEARHPRTALGVKKDGTLLFVTVDGRRPEHSVGMSLGELTDLLQELGAVSAINLDGGGSTTMVIAGETVNVPSDPNGERENGDALLLYPKKRQEER